MHCTNFKRKKVRQEKWGHLPDGGWKYVHLVHVDIWKKDRRNRNAGAFEDGEPRKVHSPPAFGLNVFCRRILRFGASADFTHHDSAEVTKRTKGQQRKSKVSGVGGRMLVTHVRTTLLSPVSSLFMFQDSLPSSQTLSAVCWGLMLSWVAHS